MRYDEPRSERLYPRQRMLMPGGMIIDNRTEFPLVFTVSVAAGGQLTISVRVE